MKNAKPLTPAPPATRRTKAARPSRVPLDRVFHALSDAVRLGIVLKLSRQDECTCAELDEGRPKSTMSHHFKVLRSAGLVRTRIKGVTHLNRLCRDELDRAFPGLLDAVIAAAKKSMTAGRTTASTFERPH